MDARQDQISSLCNSGSISVLRSVTVTSEAGASAFFRDVRNWTAASTLSSITINQHNRKALPSKMMMWSTIWRRATIYYNSKISFKNRLHNNPDSRGSSESRSWSWEIQTVLEVGLGKFKRFQRLLLGNSMEFSGSRGWSWESGPRGRSWDSSSIDESSVDNVDAKQYIAVLENYWKVRKNVLSKNHPNNQFLIHAAFTR